VTEDQQAWLARHVAPTGPPELVKQRPWATTWRIPAGADEVVFFKACAPVQAFEPQLTASVHARWPDRVSEVIAHDDERAWLLLRDAGTALEAFDDQLDTWLVVLPQYAELQIGETAHSQEHVDRGVPDRRPEVLPALYDEMTRADLPLDAGEIGRLRAFGPRFAEHCDGLAQRGIASSIQHDDLHHLNVFVRDGVHRVLDWGDASVAHPFFSLVTTFRHIERVNALDPRDPWFDRARAAYLEPWGAGFEETLRTAIVVGEFAYAIGDLRVLAHIDGADAVDHRRWFAVMLRRALARRV
jgi:hypothetical protein